MTSNTVDELGRAVLEAIADERVTLAALDDRFEASQRALEGRLSQLVDNGLARETDDGAYELTENGRRLLAATPVGAHDDRIDTPDAVERAIEEASLRPDEAAAVRGAFSFLRTWGEATTAELIDGVYSEVPAGYETAERWWDACVRDRLEALPDVEAPEASPIGTWRYEGTAEVDRDDRDGREVRDPDAASSVGSVRHALEREDLSEGERRAARAAFAVLADRGRATVGELTERVYDDHPAGHESATAWAAWLSTTFETLPNVERTGVTGDANAEGWTYDPSGETE